MNSNGHYRDLPLRQWIKHALRVVETDGTYAAASPDYVKASMKVAISLAYFMTQEVQNSSGFNLVSRDDRDDRDDMASLVRVRLKQSSSLQECDDNGENAGASANIGNQASLDAEHIDYLDVEKAYIQYHDTTRDSFDVNSLGVEETKQTFYLGLVYYELFSGTELPSELSELNNLASLDGAFVSLPKLSIAKKSIDESFVSNSKRHHGPSLSSGRDIGLCDLAFEYLKMHGVTSPLCLLVFNMVGSIYGDMSGNESYKNISDVLSDLQLIMNNPKFLQDLDTEKLSKSGLSLDELVVPRVKELELIMSCYTRFSQGSSELVVINGESGTGKSWLAHKVAVSIAAAGGVFLAGKFDQMKQAKPFCALASAFDQYCDILLSDKTSNWATCVTDELKSIIGQDARYLFNLIPKLREVLDYNSCDVSPDAGKNSVERLHHLLSQFVKVIARSSNGPLVLFLDDVQWSDEASISVLHRLLRLEHKKLFFICSCRDDEMEDDHIFWKMIEEVSANNITRTVVKLTGIEIDTLNMVISDLLRLPPRIVRSLSKVVFSKTKGNVLFVLQLLHSLNRDGVLYLDLNRKRWLWDEDKILSMKLPDNVALCLLNGIGKLPSQVQSALHTLSMFGSSSKSKYIKLLEEDLNVKLIEHLHIAVAEGLVNYLDGSFYFSHDRIQKVSYDMVEEHDRSCNHLMYGKCLVQHALATGSDDLLFTSVNQINIGGPSAIEDSSDYFKMAEHNLTAGKRAMLTDFASAFSFFDHGMTFLRKDCWKAHYDFSLELHELAAKTSLVLRKTGALHILSHQILKNAKCLDDKLNIYFTIISSLLYSHKIAGALERCLDILSQLGVAIPSNLSQKIIANEVEQTLSSINDIPEEELLHYRPMCDRRKLMIHHFYVELSVMALFVRPILHPYVAAKMVRLTLSHGISRQSPIGFASFGLVLAELGNMPGARQCLAFSRAFLGRFSVNEYAGQALGAMIELQVLLEPLQAANELRNQGEELAFSSGDIHWACIHRLQYTVNMFWGGTML